MTIVDFVGVDPADELPEDPLDALLAFDADELEEPLLPQAAAVATTGKIASAATALLALSFITRTILIDVGRGTPRAPDCWYHASGTMFSAQSRAVFG